MTAATVADTPARPTPAEVLGLDHPSAIAIAEQLAAIPDVAVRRRYAAQAVEDRRADLALYRTLYAERWGRVLHPSRVEADDDLLTELLVLAVA